MSIREELLGANTLRGNRAQIVFLVCRSLELVQLLREQHLRLGFTLDLLHRGRGLTPRVELRVDHRCAVVFSLTLALVVLHLYLLLELLVNLLRLVMECLRLGGLWGHHLALKAHLTLVLVDGLESVVLSGGLDAAVVDVTVYLLASITTHGIALIQKLNSLLAGVRKVSFGFNALDYDKVLVVEPSCLLFRVDGS